MLDLIESVPLQERVMRLSEITVAFTKHLKSKGLEYIEANRRQMLIYGLSTLLCLVVDLALYIWAVWAFFNMDMVFIHHLMP